jgi:hypothetical protein
MFSPQNLKPVSAEEYFYIYNYNYFIRLLNKTMETLVTTTGSRGTPPIFNYDPVTKLISLTIDESQYGYNEENYKYGTEYNFK